jgi:RNA polymerase sigma-70 factor (ECF subfamily)
MADALENQGLSGADHSAKWAHRKLRPTLGPASQSAHASRRRSGATDWRPASAVLYDALFALTGSPVVAVNRAVAVADAHGAAAGLRLLESAGAAGRLDGYQSYWAAKAALQARIGEAGAADRYRRAIGLESDAATRGFLLGRLSALET